MKRISYYIITIFLTAVACCFLMRKCGGPAGFPNNLQHKNDSLTQVTAAIQKRNVGLEKFILQQEVKIKRSDSVRVAAISKFRSLKPKYLTMPCDSAIPAVIIETERIVSADSTLVHQLQQKADSLQAIHANDKEVHKNDTAVHFNDSTALAAVRSQLSGKFWKGFKIGFITGNITGASTNLLRR